MRGRGRHGYGRQRRGRHMLRPTLLFLMHQGSSHGYELMDQLEGFGVIDIDPSLVYRALRDMEAEGLITSAWNEEDTQGPPRRMYTLTSSGDRILREHLEDLKNTRSRIDKLVRAYQRHMDRGQGDFHK